MRRILRVFLVGALAAVLAACGSSGGLSSGTAETVATEPAVSSIQVTINTTHHQCQADLSTKPGTCYLPFYTEATYNGPSMPINSAPGSKCTPEDESQCWGQPGTKLEAVCVTYGDLVRDSRGVSDEVWVGVVIPDAEILIDETKLASTKREERVGFAPVIWLRQIEARPTLRELGRCENMLLTAG